MVSISDISIKEMKFLHKEFVWSNRTTKIKHSALIGDYAEGGLKDIDIESNLILTKLSWVRRLIDSKFHPRKELVTHFLLPLGGRDSFFHSNFKFGAKSQNAVGK